MSALLTLSEAGAQLRCRDPRTARKRLDLLGVPTVAVGRSVLVRQVDLERAVAAAARVTRPAAGASPAGVTLAPGARLWDSPGAGSKQEGPRRANGRPHGTGSEPAVQAQPNRQTGDPSFPSACPDTREEMT